MPPVAAPPAATPTPPAPTPGSDALAPSEANALSTPTPSTTSAFTPGTPDAFTAPGSTDNLNIPGTAAAAPSGTSWLTGASNWIHNNPELSRAAFQGASGLLASVSPSPQNRYYAAAANNQQTQADIAAMKAGTKPGWWYGAPTGG
jgi:hypothetical protein